MEIASRHSWKDPDFKPLQKWADVYVQWGSKGVVFSKKGNYRTAFFEVFPSDSEDAGGFIRGEGETIADAELAAFKKYQRNKSCYHQWGRAQYTNGGAICRKCGAFQTKFNQVIALGDWRRPLSRIEQDSLVCDEGFRELGDKRPESKYIRKLKLRKAVFGLEET